MNYKRVFIPNSLIFITIVTKDRKDILIDNIEILKSAFKITKDKYEFKIIAIAVNPNHIHMILKLNDINLYPQIISCIKRNFTKNSNIKYSLNKNRESNIWQRRYWEHTILSEYDLYRHIDYIHYNSVKHFNIAPKDWEYSSFNKYVSNGYYSLDWCNLEDKYEINNLSFE